MSGRSSSKDPKQANYIAFGIFMSGSFYQKLVISLYCYRKWQVNEHGAHNLGPVIGQQGYLTKIHKALFNLDSTVVC